LLAGGYNGSSESVKGALGEKHSSEGELAGLIPACVRKVLLLVPRGGEPDADFTYLGICTSDHEALMGKGRVLLPVSKNGVTQGLTLF
jgi:hypothetical protein